MRPTPFDQVVLHVWVSLLTYNILRDSKYSTDENGSVSSLLSFNELKNNNTLLWKMEEFMQLLSLYNSQVNKLL